MDGYTFFIEDNVLYITFTKVYSLKDSTQIINNILKTSSLIHIVAEKDILGYWSSFDYLNKTSIYCGTMRLKDTKTKIKEYLKINKNGK